jgi:phosphoribosylformylglycinamidine cyclo-ligase
VKDVVLELEKAGESVLAIGRVEAGAKGCTVAGSRGAWSARDDWSAVHHG